MDSIAKANIQIQHEYLCKRLPEDTEAALAMPGSFFGWRRSERKILIIPHACSLYAFEEIFIWTQCSCCTSSHPSYLSLTFSNCTWVGTCDCKARQVRPIMIRWARHAGFKHCQRPTVLKPPSLKTWLAPSTLKPRASSHVGITWRLSLQIGANVTV